MRKRTFYNTKKRGIYKVEVMTGYAKRTEYGFEFPNTAYVAEFCYYRDALDFYKKEKQKNTHAVHFYNKDGSIRYFKTI